MKCHCSPLSAMPWRTNTLTEYKAVHVGSTVDAASEVEPESVFGSEPQQGMGLTNLFGKNQLKMVHHLMAGKLLATATTLSCKMRKVNKP